MFSKKMIAALVCSMMVLLLPLTIYIGKREKEKHYQNETKIVFSQEDISQDSMKVIVLIGESPTEMTMHDYLIGVVSAEMPALYPEEALKAQVIAARTNTLYKMRIRSLYPKEAGHENADVCVDFSHCQAYRDHQALKERWGNEYENFLSKITKAVEDTDGCYVAYQGKIISALFHSASSGRTESALDVWGSDYPYLQSVDSHWDRESGDYKSEITLTKAEFEEKVKAKYPSAIIPEDYSVAVADIDRSQAGGIRKIKLMGIELTGKELRNLFSLRSTNVTFRFEEDSVTMSILGYGHGVGLSQDGSCGMAKEGYKAEDILLHYYSGCKILKRNELAP